MEKIVLRRLEKKDADLMLEWMHDPDINSKFRFDFANMTKEKVLEFIDTSYEEKNKNFAFVNARDEYLGTISLKNISMVNLNAEYAIVTRKMMQGTGMAFEATQQILHYAFDTLKLHKVYLNVLADNTRANFFYQKCGFEYEGKARDQVLIRGEYRDLNWYGMIREKFI